MGLGTIIWAIAVVMLLPREGYFSTPLPLLVWSGLVLISIKQFGAVRAVWNTQSYKRMGLDWLSLNSLPLRSPQSGANKHHEDAEELSNVHD